MELEESGVYRNIGEKDLPPRKESWMWGEKESKPSDRAWTEKKPVYGVGGPYKPRQEEYKPPYAEFEPMSTDRSDPRRSNAGGGGAIVNNYYGGRSNNSFVSEPE